MENVTLIQQINALKGTYYLKNNYVKRGKKIPFIVKGTSFSTEYPVLVSTFKYRGMKRTPHEGQYTIESLPLDYKLEAKKAIYTLIENQKVFMHENKYFPLNIQTIFKTLSTIKVN